MVECETSIFLFIIISECEPTDLVLVPNVTTAVNCVLRSQQLKPGDKVFSLSTEYGEYNTIEYIHEH